MEIRWVKRAWLHVNRLPVNTLAFLSPAPTQQSVTLFLLNPFLYYFLCLISLIIPCVSAAWCKHQQLEKPWITEPAGLGASNWRDRHAREVCVDSNWREWDACCKVRVTATGEWSCRLQQVEKKECHRALGLCVNEWEDLPVFIFPS